MKTKLIWIVLAGISLLAVADNSFGAPQNSRYRYNWRWDGRHLLPSRVVPMVSERSVTIWITNDNGSQTEVRLVAAYDGGYTGPKGEYYSSMPTEGQLKAMYGLQCAAPVKNNVIFYLGRIDGIERVVVLTKDGSEFVGPKGEHYPTIPTEEQLKLIYGK